MKYQWTNLWKSAWPSKGRPSKKKYGLLLRKLLTKEILKHEFQAKSKKYEDWEKNVVTSQIRCLGQMPENST